MEGDFSITPVHQGERRVFARCSAGTRLERRLLSVRSVFCRFGSDKSPAPRLRPDVHEYPRATSFWNPIAGETTGSSEMARACQSGHLMSIPGDPNMLVIDVEGFEPAVVAGAKRLLADPKLEIIIVETLGLASTTV
jgi:hypothetical protein